MNPKPSRIEAIVFDAYGTLLNPSSIGERLAGLLPGHWESILHTWRQKQLEYTWLRTCMGRYKDFYALTEDALHYALSAHGAMLMEASVRQLMSAYYELSAYEDVQPALSNLSEHYQLAVLSNANPSLLERGTHNAGIADYFQVLMSADEVGVFKPRPEVYALATHHLSCPKEAILFVSSNTWDIAGAASAGLFTAWINRSGGVSEQLGYDASYILQTLTAISEVL
jgi:2-haloacid dehalogenase